MSAATPTAARSETLGESLAATSYVGLRLVPSLADPHFICRQDLLRLIERLAPRVEGKLFDFGCGGAPYKPLFSKVSRYVAADVTAGPNVDLLLGFDGNTGEPDASYDFVFSTQVLEHVPDPERYLSECRRILRPGGRILLTTHGMFEEHGCPSDYYRWTAHGLRRALERSGFLVEENYKLSAGIRGCIQNLHTSVAWLLCPEYRVLHRLLAIVRRIYAWLAVPVGNWVAERAPAQAIVSENDVSGIYLGVAIVARKLG